MKFIAILTIGPSRCPYATFEGKDHRLVIAAAQTYDVELLDDVRMTLKRVRA